jgi:hypothetical protein
VRRVAQPVGVVRVVPSTHVAVYGQCDTDDGSGLCLVAAASFRCFPISDVFSGRAVARTPDGRLLGIVPDGIERVTLSVAGPSTSTEVVDNVFEAQLDAIRGTRVELAMHRADGCRRTVAPELLQRTAILREAEQPTLVLPADALDELREWRIDAVVEDGARFWGERDGVDFWVVPVVPTGQERCAPATRVCVVAIPESARPDGQCALGGDKEQWRLAPLLPGHATIYGVVPNDVRGARVTIGEVTGDVDAREGVVGGVLPFAYDADLQTRVELLR